MELVAQLDNTSCKNLGENNHPQYSWINSDFETNITRLFFQIVRAASYNYSIVSDKYNDIIKIAIENNNKNQINYCISLLFQTRDHNGGKGEYALFYALLAVWDNYWNYSNIGDILTNGLTLCFEEKNKHEMPYGSWKDVKYIFNYYAQLYSKEQIICNWKNYPVLASIMKIVKNKYKSISEYNSKKSLFSRWMPRENSKKFGWIANIIVKDIYGDIRSKTQLKKYLARYRRFMAYENKKLNTIQINQCKKTWKNIDFEKHSTSLTMQRQKNAFLCIGSNKNAENQEDRVICKNNYIKYIEKCKNGNAVMKSSKVGLGEMVKQAYKYANRSMVENSVEVDALNTAWQHQCKNSLDSIFENAIAILDTSASMTWENCPFYDAMGLAIRIAEKSSLGKRIMTFSNKPSWMIFDEIDTLTGFVNKIKHEANIGCNTDIYASMQMIADACVEKDLHPSSVENMFLCILSDMQIDSAIKNYNNATLNDNIKAIFHNAGCKTSFKCPYKPPIIIYWNMRATKGFPTATNEPGCILVSGYTMDVIEELENKGPITLQKITPWENLKNILEKPRYSKLWK